MKNRILAFAARLGMGWVLRRLKPANSITVLCLHRVTEETDYFWPPMRPATFERLLQYCQKHYEVVDFPALSAPASGKKPRLVLSFDDGYKDFMEYALPLLTKYNLPCNHNVVINCLERNEPIWTQRFNILANHLRDNKLSGQLLPALEETKFSGQTADWFKVYNTTIQVLLDMPRQARMEALEEWEKTYLVPANAVSMMDWEDVMVAQQQGVSFGSHTISHDSLPTLPEKELFRELKESKAILELKTGKPCEVISLPNGQCSSLVVKTANQVGYRFVLLLNEHLYHPGTKTPQLIGRINMVEESDAMMKLRAELIHRPKNILNPSNKINVVFNS